MLVTQATDIVVLLFLVLLAGTVFGQILTGQINTRYLFYGMRQDGSRYFSPERVQLALFTIWTAGSYLIAVITNPHRDALPDVPSQTLYLLGGSHMLYLGGKAYNMLLRGTKVTSSDDNDSDNSDE